MCHVPKAYVGTLRGYIPAKSKHFPCPLAAIRLAFPLRYATSAAARRLAFDVQTGSLSSSVFVLVVLQCDDICIRISDVDSY